MIRDYDVRKQTVRAFEAAVGHVLGKPELRDLIMEIGGRYTTKQLIHTGPFRSIEVEITIGRDDLLYVLIP